MNPPSAIHGAMSRDRKPFTYTPGGIDLSEIKSEKMAKRLMRNAMNEGVPQQPAQPIQSPPASAIAVPNFNCLPVQVFPAFNLPANPKSLLRTRSNPVSREPPQRVVPSQFVNNKAPVQYDTFNKNTPPCSQINNNRPTSMFEYGTLGVTPFMNYGNEACNATFPSNDSYNTTFPEISYDAQYFQAPKINSYIENTAPPVIIRSDIANDKNSIAKIDDVSIAPKYDFRNDDIQLKSKEIYAAPVYEIKESVDTKPEIVTTIPEAIVVQELQIQGDVGYNDEQKEVKIVTKEVKKEAKLEEQNGDQNGDTEAVMTVKLPSKKSAAKTETKVEISKKTLPDGSIEEVKKTITKTTIDGKTEIKTKTETTIIPKDDDEEEEEVEEEEEEEIGEGVVTEVDEQELEKKPVATVVKTAEESSTQIRENGQDNIIKTEERSETTTTSTKKVVIVQDDQNDENEEEEVEEEEIEEEEPVTVVLKKTEVPSPPEEKVEEEEETQNIKNKEVEVEKLEKIEELKVESQEAEEDVQEITKSVEKEEEEVVEEEEEYEEAEEKELEVEVVKEPETAKAVQQDEKSEYDDEESEPEKVEAAEKPVEETEIPIEEPKAPAEEPEVPAEQPADPVEIEIPIQKESDVKQDDIVEKQEDVKQEVPKDTQTEVLQTPEPKAPLREPSVPMEKVEDVEIKPIGAGNFITKTRTETTEIVTGTGDKPTGLLTEYNRTENIVTVNRTTKTLDYENSAPPTIPTLTYFTPHIEKFPPSPQPTNRPYQPVYPSEPSSERRHSLLLERLSVERQIPTNEIYQNTQQYNQTTEQQNQWAQEPRVEILTIENVKPSSITNQQWYQQTDKKDVIYNNVAPVAPPVAPSWTQPKQQQQPAYQPPSQPAYQQPQPTYQAQHQPKPVYQPPQPQPVYQTQPQYHPQPITQSQTQPQYQSSYTENLQQNTSSQQNTYSSQQNFSTYTPKPTNWDAPRINEPSQYSSDSYQNTQQRSSSYVPPPWEQDSTYVVDNSQNYYQPSQQNTFTPDINNDWKPAAPAPKFTKTTPTAYIPPKPNQSFVKHVTIAEPPKQPGRKTYYSEYERRYISVPESTYIPGETKLQPPQSQPQPDPSPAYYYDNNEPAETVEHQWRKELREFTEKAQTQQPENVQPQWATTIENKTQTQYAKTQETTYTATPTWSQTLRPQSWRERSFESEFVSQEWPKTNTLGRGRPLSSSFGRESSVVPERTRGVSVDRYNPNNYQAPVPEPHPPVQTFTHNPPAPHATGYHNPNVPAYHAARASAEPREQPVYQQPRARVESRASPFQSRSFKYLQWITGTED